MHKLINKLNCFVAGHDWKFEYSVEKSPTGPGNVYRCERCGDMDKV